MNTTRLLRRLLCALLAWTALHCSAADAVRVPFKSFTPVSLFDLAREKRDRWPATDVWGDLSIPAGTGSPVPAVVLAHGSDGVTPSLAQWVALFNDLGVATFVVDSFTPRGVTSTASDQTSVPAAANLMDAFQALQLLARDPRIDARRIGIMGFSRGGTVAFQTAEQPFLRAVVKGPEAFAFHVAAYAGCLQIYTSPEVTGAPLLNLVGAADDYTHPEPCEALATEYAALGTPVKSVRYDGAHHAWDSLLPVRWLPNATSGYACGVVRTDIPSWTVTALRTGAVIPAAQLTAFFNECVTRGAHVGRNAAAFDASRGEVARFVQQVLAAPPR
ncbi:dienelactone hydrolase family protein [Mitsuaria sp. GD03876]|uniref:dienelactone hydrolase family protein n=1 Tax=Mitsuaria sp. GD03876 TaxID=2975399 RepID=UPI00244B83A5|nr:dienelactone hydrolase family protein [Mitsuaria sp. GD03876]MDH0867126.1 dienelactone hydrolase family protein [Mitsuaria sp. GD03876]